MDTAVRAKRDLIAHRKMFEQAEQIGKIFGVEMPKVIPVPGRPKEAATLQKEALAEFMVQLHERMSEYEAEVQEEKSELKKQVEAAKAERGHERPTLARTEE